MEFIEIIFILIITAFAILCICVLAIFCLDKTITIETKNPLIKTNVKQLSNPYTIKELQQPNINDPIINIDNHYQCILCNEHITKCLAYKDCGHYFHITCLDKWNQYGNQFITHMGIGIDKIESYKYYKCPECFKELYKGDATFIQFINDKYSNL